MDFLVFGVAFYAMHVSENSYFWSAKKVTKNTSSELESFVELVGGVSSGEAALARAESLAQRLEPEAPLLENGLSPSGDGYFWGRS
jgi:FAD-dependent halogenase